MIFIKAVHDGVKCKVDQDPQKHGTSQMKKPLLGDKNKSKIGLPYIFARCRKRTVLKLAIVR